MIKEPMLAAKLPSIEQLLDNLPYPCLGSPKIDGIRAIGSNHEGVPRLYSRKLKLIPNRHTQFLFGDKRFLGLDGELVVGPPNTEGLFQRTTSGVMSQDGEPDVSWYVFDDFSDPGIQFQDRLDGVKKRYLRWPDTKVVYLAHTELRNPAEVRKFHDKCILGGFEGSMYRHPEAPYKPGRATVREKWLFKLKEWYDEDGTVVDVYELMHNSNEAEINELGRTKRSSHQAGMVPMGTLGGFTVRTEDGRVFNLGGGPGLTTEMRWTLWQRREHLIGLTVKFTSLRVGVKTLPRHPQFLGFRED